MSETNCLIDLNDDNFISLVVPFNQILLISKSTRCKIQIADVPDFGPVNFLVLYDPCHDYCNIEHPFLLCSLKIDSFTILEEETARYSKYVLQPLLLCTSPLFSFPYNFMKSFYSFEISDSVQTF